MFDVAGVDGLGHGMVAVGVFPWREHGDPVLIIKVFGYGRTGGAGHFHEPGIVTGHEEGGVEQLVDFGKLVEFGGVADLPFHLPDDGSEGFHVRLGPERQGFGDARPFEDTRDDVAVVDFLSGHLPDVFALLRLRGDQPLLNEHLQRFPDGGSADPELLREDGLFDRSADFQRAFTDK